MRKLTEDQEERAQYLAFEIQRELEGFLLKDPHLAHGHMLKVKEMRNELATMGVHVTWELEADIHNFMQRKSRVVVTLWLPRYFQ